MTPYKLTGIASFMTTYGPMRVCIDETNGLSLWPTTPNVYALVSDGLSKQQLSYQPGDPDKILKSLPEAETIITTLAPCAGAALADPSGARWVFAQKPNMATAFSILQVIRVLQAVSAKTVATAASSDMASSAFLPTGYGRQFAELKSVIATAEKFRSETHDVVRELHGLTKREEGDEDGDIAKLVHPPTSKFITILDDANAVFGQLENGALAKGKYYLESASSEVNRYCYSDFRDWTGSICLSARSLAKIKQYMLVPGFKKLMPAVEVLDQRIKDVRAASTFLPVETICKAAEELVHSGRVYVAVAGALLNTVVKKAKGASEEQLTRDCRVCIKGLAEMRLWTREVPSKELKDDGREVVSKVCPSVLLSVLFTCRHLSCTQLL